VPTLRADDGQFISENAAILQYVADQRPQRCGAPSWRGTRRHEGASNE
jgi:glutathione S-transferase